MPITISRMENKKQKTGYVEANLSKDEVVIKKAKLHWFIFAKSAITLFISILLYNMDDVSHLGTFALLLSVFFFIEALIKKYTTELAVTNKRVIAKYGLIMRLTIELNLSKIEGLNVHQGIMGRIFDFGDIIVSGTGGKQSPIRYIENPLEFRKTVNEQIED